MNSPSFPPPPLRSPLGLVNGIITDEAWLAWFTRSLFAVVSQASDIQLSGSDLLMYRQAAEQDPGNSGLGLGSGLAAGRRSAETGSEFPPPSPGFVAFSDLEMMAAVRPLTQVLPAILADTHANRALYPNSAYPVDALFFETDRTVWFRNTGTAWLYVGGIMYETLANKPTLGTDDAGFLFGATDYLHCWKWSGTAWAFAPGDPGSGFISEGKPDGSAPNGGLWGLADGSTYAVSKSDATTSNIVTVNRTNDSFPEGSTTFGAKAAARAKWEAAAVTDDESAHTHQVDPPNTASGNDKETAVTLLYTAGVASQAIPAEPHTHDVNIAAFASGDGSAHHHTLSDANAQLKVPSEANGGLPARVGVGYYIRR